VGLLVVPVTTPEQLSVVVGVLTVAEQLAVIMDSVGVTGAVVSMMTTVWVAVLLFPAPSVKVQSMVWVP
jgi:hypothetical protein